MMRAHDSVPVLALLRQDAPGRLSGALQGH
jgi:hypothetical protein